LTALKIIIFFLSPVYVLCPAFSQPDTGKISLNKGGRNPGATVCRHVPGDFRVIFNVCNQNEVDFINSSATLSAVAWNFGDGAIGNATNRVSHVYKGEGVYTVMLVVSDNNNCFDTVFKKFLLNIDTGNIFLNKDLKICNGGIVRLPGDPDASQHCWSPGGYLDSFDIYDPVCSTPVNATYQYNIVKRSPNVVNNGNFSNGNSGFSSEYILDSLVNTAGHYFVCNKPRLWNPLYQDCTTDTMLVVNGSTVKSLAVWKSRLHVTANTNYAFSFNAYSLTKTKSLVLEVSINQGEVIGRVQLSDTACEVKNFSTTWFSSLDTLVNITITDLDTAGTNNNFALDSIGLRAISLKTDSLSVTIAERPEFTVDPLSAAICSGDSVMLTASGGDIYHWYPATTVAQPHAPASLVFPSFNTTYKIVITDSTCGITDSVFTTVYVKAGPKITLSKSNDVNCALMQSTLNATGGISYHWQPENTLSNPYICNPTATPNETTTYHITATGENSCLTEDTIQVKVLTGEGVNLLLLPTAFTPNNDGLNDCFGVRSWGYITDLQFVIYNRWGDLVFASTNSSQCWDGTFKGMPQPLGSYAYFIKGNTFCGHTIRKGTIMLLR
jgi:gliding motility-associated-like protein